MDNKTTSHHKHAINQLISINLKKPRQNSSFQIYKKLWVQATNLLIKTTAQKTARKNKYSHQQPIQLVCLQTKIIIRLVIIKAKNKN